MRLVDNVFLSSFCVYILNSMDRVLTNVIKLTRPGQQRRANVNKIVRIIIINLMSLRMRSRIEPHEIVDNQLNTTTIALEVWK